MGGLPTRDPNHAQYVADFALLVQKAVNAVKSPADGTPLQVFGSFLCCYFQFIMEWFVRMVYDSEFVKWFDEDFNSILILFYFILIQYWFNFNLLLILNVFFCYDTLPGLTYTDSYRLTQWSSHGRSGR